MSRLLPATIELTSTAKEISAGLRKDIASFLNRILRNSVRPIKSRVSVVIENAIRQTDVIQSLLDGQLKGEMGLISPPSVVEPIIQTIIKSIEIKFKKVVFPTGGEPLGGITIGILKADFSDILSLPTSNYRSNEFDITWLDWLLIEGDSIIWRTYDVTFDLNQTQQRRSRSGDAIMIKSKVGWRVPPQFSGTKEDNFLTKALNNDTVGNSVIKIIQQEVSQRI